MSNADDNNAKLQYTYFSTSPSGSLEQSAPQKYVGHGPWAYWKQPDDKERAVIQIVFDQSQYIPTLKICFPPRKYSDNYPGYFSNSGLNPHTPSGATWTYVRYKRKHKEYFLWIENKYCPRWIKGIMESPNFPFHALDNLDTILNAYDLLENTFVTDPIDYYKGFR